MDLEEDPEELTAEDLEEDPEQLTATHFGCSTLAEGCCLELT